MLFAGSSNQSLVAKMRAYYRDPTAVAAAIEAVETVLSNPGALLFDPDWSRHLAELWSTRPNVAVPCHTYYTSGSTGRPRPYMFGPTDWITWVEGRCKFPAGRRCCVYVIQQAEGAHCVLRATEQQFCDYLLLIGGLDAYIAHRTLSMLRDVLRNHGPLMLRADPNVFLYLTRDDEFSHFLAENARSISLCSTNWEPFYRKRRLRSLGMHINDNMIDWHQGLNFYTCEFNNRHVLPLFVVVDGRIWPISNLAARGSQRPDDLFMPVRHIPCQCGMTATEFVYVPHINTAIRIDGRIVYDADNLPELLEGLYDNLQFEYHHGTMVVHYRGRMPDVDRDIIVEAFPGTAIEWRSGSWQASAGHKYPAFLPSVRAGGR